MPVANPDVLYIPKIGRLGQIGAQMQYGFMAMTPEWLFFIPQLTHTEVRSAGTTEMTQTRVGDFLGREFFSIVPEASQTMDTKELEDLLLEMADRYDHADKLPVSEIRNYKVGFLSFAAATPERKLKLHIGISGKIKKQIRAYLKQRGLQH